MATKSVKGQRSEKAQSNTNSKAVKGCRAEQSSKGAKSVRSKAQSSNTME